MAVDWKGLIKRLDPPDGLIKGQLRAITRRRFLKRAETARFHADIFGEGISP